MIFVIVVTVVMAAVIVAAGGFQTPANLLQQSKLIWCEDSLVGRVAKMVGIPFLSPPLLGLIWACGVARLGTIVDWRRLAFSWDLSLAGCDPLALSLALSVLQPASTISS